MALEDLRALSAPSALLYVAGVQVGWAGGVDITETITKVPIMKLGDVHVQKYETTAVSVSGTFSYIHIMQLPLSSQLAAMEGMSPGELVSLWPNPGNAAQQTSSQRSDYYVKFPELNLAMVDKFSGQKMIQVFGLNPQSRSFSLSNGGLLAVNVSWVARALVERPIPNAGIYS